MQLPRTVLLTSTLRAADLVELGAHAVGHDESLGGAARIAARVHRETLDVLGDEVLLDLAGAQVEHLEVGAVFLRLAGVGRPDRPSMMNRSSGQWWLVFCSFSFQRVLPDFGVKGRHAGSLGEDGHAIRVGDAQ